MRTKAHDVITACVVRKMREQGYEIVGLDSDHTLVDVAKFPVPEALYTHRPDVLGINLETEEICIGEAKTANDLSSKRTKTQLVEFAAMKSKDGRSCKVVLGVPESGETELKRLLSELGLTKAPNLSYLIVPDVLVSDEALSV